MEKKLNISVIEDYLSTLPKDWTVEDILNNHKKAFDTFEAGIKKMMEEKEVNVGKCFYMEDKDYCDEERGSSDLIVVKYYYKINSVFRLNKETVGYKADVFEISGDVIYAMNDVFIQEQDLNCTQLITTESYNKISQMYEHFVNDKPEFII